MPTSGYNSQELFHINLLGKDGIVIVPIIFNSRFTDGSNNFNSNRLYFYENSKYAFKTNKNRLNISFPYFRFELPLDMQVLHTMTPLDYLARYVSISSSRRQLYNKVYCRHRSLKDNMLNETVSLGQKISRKDNHVKS